MMDVREQIEWQRTKANDIEDELKMSVVPMKMRALADTMEKLYAVYLAARDMRNDYEAYSYNTVSKKYDVPQHDVAILTKFNVAFNATLGERNELAK